MTNAHTDLGLTEKSATGGGCCGGSCACGDAVAQSAPAVGLGASEQKFAVTGMTCNNCVNHVTKAVTAVPGVTGVRIDLDPTGTSVVHVAGAGVDATAVRAAVEEAGYQPA